MIVGISGFSGSGKDAAADILVKHGYVKVAFADPLKRYVKEIYDFSYEQLWGPSEERNKPDKRYPREHTWDFDGMGNPELSKCMCCGTSDETAQCYLTPRYALQLLGTEWGRHCYDGTWVEYALRVARALHSEDPIIRPTYRPERGLDFTDCNSAGRSAGYGGKVNGVVISDVRFRNEIVGLREGGAHVLRIKRTGYEKPRWNHLSETEQTEFSDESFSSVIHNTGTLEDLEKHVREVVQSLS